MKTTQEILIGAKAAARKACLLTADIKNEALRKMADALEANTQTILQANAVDLQNATGVLPEVMLIDCVWTKSALPLWRKAYGKLPICPTP